MNPTAEQAKEDIASGIQAQKCIASLIFESSFAIFSSYSSAWRMKEVTRQRSLHSPSLWRFCWYPSWRKRHTVLTILKVVACSLIVLVAVMNIAIVRRERQSHKEQVILSSSAHPPQPFVSHYDQELPEWFHAYIDWHRQQRAQLNQNNWKEFRFLIVRCIHGADPVCGGLADRLTPLPSLVRWAAQSKRILFIHWTRPAPLEAWYQPHQLNWTAPDYVPKKGPHTKLYVKWKTLLEGTAATTTVPVICTRIQQQKETNTDVDARSVFAMLFQPPYSNNNDEPFVAAHIRSRYGHHPVPAEKLHAVTEWAVDCARQQQHNATTHIKVFSDSAAVVQYAATLPHVMATTTTTTTPPKHLDKDEGSSAEEFASVFMDLWWLAQAECVIYGPGGYGRLGAALSKHPECAQAYFQDGRYQQCVAA